MSGCFLKEDIEQMKGLVEEKVNNYRLGVFKDENEVKELTEKSPSLKELQNGAHR